MEGTEPLFHIGPIGITMSIVIQWVIIVVLGIGSFFLTRNLKKIPDKRQSALEIFVVTVKNLINENMDESYSGFLPYVGTLILYLIFMNLTPLVGLKGPTEDFSVCLGMGAVTFLVIQGYTIRKVGLLHFFTGFVKPLPVLLPINLLERFTLPISLSLRLFGNLTAGAVVMKLLYDALYSLNVGAQFAIPIPLHFYFDVFDGVIQMIIFVMLTIINIKVIADH